MNWYHHEREINHMEAFVGLGIVFITGCAYPGRFTIGLSVANGIGETDTTPLPYHRPGLGGGVDTRARGEFVVKTIYDCFISTCAIGGSCHGFCTCGIPVRDRTSTFACSTCCSYDNR